MLYKTQRIGSEKRAQVRLDIVNGSFCNLCALAVALALHIFATQCWRVPIRTKQLSTVAILLYRFLSCWCLETFLCGLHEVYSRTMLRPRGGWTRAELHHGLILQYASVCTISHAVRTSGQATEDPLKSEFLPLFRCKCWTLNVMLLHNSSGYLSNTWWLMKTIKRRGFLRSNPRVTSPARSRSINLPLADGYFHISCHFLTFIDTWIIVLPKKCRFTLLSQ